MAREPGLAELEVGAVRHRQHQRVQLRAAAPAAPAPSPYSAAACVAVASGSWTLAAMPKLASSRRMSGTRLLRRSGTFSLKRQPQHAPRAPGAPARPRAISSLTSFCATKRAHAVVDPPAGQDHLGMVAQALGLGGEVVGVDADAVAADQARRERQEVPLGRRRPAARRGCGCPAGRRSAPARSSARC